MKTTETTPPARGVGRPRSMASRQAILNTAFRLARNEGFQSLTIERIAREASVGKPTIYRWWPSKGAILFEVLLQQAKLLLPVPAEEMPLSTSLTTFLQALFKVLNGEIGNIIKSLMAEAQHDPAFAELFRTEFILVRRKPVLTLLQRGIERGELAPQTNIEVLADLIYGAMWYRLLTQHAPLDDNFACDIVQTLLYPLY